MVRNSNYESDMQTNLKAGHDDQECKKLWI